ncbi:SURF1 family protein [Roseibium salinum]|nr:SURF1 family protein [Roseibium salinum]
MTTAGKRKDGRLSRPWDPSEKLLLPAAAAAAALVILLSLGFWQLDRLAWKESLIAKVEEAVSAPAVEAPGPAEWGSLEEEDDYRHVRVTGSFLEDAVFYYTALADPAGPIGGPGVMVYAPFRTSDGWVVLVNRGFSSAGPRRRPTPRRHTAARGPAGTHRTAAPQRKKPNWTTPEPDMSDRIWFARDTGAMGEALGVEPAALAPYSIDLDAEFTPSSGLPQAGETIVRFKNDHLGYALTWFGLATTLVGVFLTYAAGILWPRNRKTG